ncbi:MAG: hypothetical protein K9L62_00340 [Vallitaleaceae bacterium]|nr:hypothetical protein [Vallitaleaceae bacterium]
MKRGKCRGCGAEIVWIQTNAGKSMPCDPCPVPYWEKSKAQGKVVTPNGETLSCEFNGDIKNATGYGYISHFSTCPQAARFKKK